MGVTIHFEGRLREGSLDLVIERSRAFARQHGWPIEAVDEAGVTLSRVKDEEPWDYVGPIRGVHVFPHPDAEPVRLEFDRELYIQEYTKTQFAGSAVHVAVIELIRAIEPFFGDLSVMDEGEFWETGDRALLDRNIESCNRALADLLEQHPDAKGNVRLDSGRIADFIS